MSVCVYNVTVHMHVIMYVCIYLCMHYILGNFDIIEVWQILTLNSLIKCPRGAYIRNCNIEWFFI